MSSRQLPGLGLTGFWDLGEDGWKDGMDVNLRLLSSLVQAVVLSRITEIPGISAAEEGEIYIVPSDAFLNANQIAVFDNGEWIYIDPQEGWSVYVADTNENVQFDGASWVEFASGSVEEAPIDGTQYARQDGAWVEVVGGGGGSGDQYVELSFFAGGLLEDGETLFTHIASQAFTVPASMTGSQFIAGDAATAEAVLDIQKNGVSVGSMTVAASGTTATYTFASETAWVIGDRLAVIAPATADATLADVSVSILANKS